MLHLFLQFIIQLKPILSKPGLKKARKASQFSKR